MRIASSTTFILTTYAVVLEEYVCVTVWVWVCVCALDLSLSFYPSESVSFSFKNTSIWYMYVWNVCVCVCAQSKWWSEKTTTTSMIRFKPNESVPYARHITKNSYSWWNFHEWKRFLLLPLVAVLLLLLLLAELCKSMNRLMNPVKYLIYIHIINVCVNIFTNI